MTATNYIYKDSRNRIYWQKRFGRDPMTLKDYKPKRYRDQNGQAFKTIDEARLDLMAFELEYNQNNHIYDSKITYGQFINKFYLPNRKQKVKSNTFKNETFVIKKLLERFGSKPITKITEIDVASLEYHLMEEHSQGYAHRIFSKFKHTLKHAVKLKYIKINVAENFYIPRPDRNFRTWDSSEVHSFLTSLNINKPKHHLLYCLTHFYFYTGVRPNEGVALHWNDLDFNKKEVSIKQTLIKEQGIPIYRQDHTKTPAGMRDIGLDDATITILKNWKKRQLEMGIDSPYIFSTNQKIPNISTISKDFKAAIKKTNCKDISIQELRHSHATYLIIEKQCSDAQVAYRLGHKKISTVYQYYVRPTQRTEKDIVKSINEGNN